MRQNHFVSTIRRRKEHKDFILFGILAIAMLYALSQAVSCAIEEQATIDQHKVMERQEQLVAAQKDKDDKAAMALFDIPSRKVRP